MVVIMLKMLWRSQISQLDIARDAYQKPNRGLIDVGFRKRDNRVRLVMAALSFYFTVEKALLPPHFVDCTMCFPTSCHYQQTALTSNSLKGNSYNTAANLSAGQLSFVFILLS